MGIPNGLASVAVGPWAGIVSSHSSTTDSERLRRQPVGATHELPLSIPDENSRPSDDRVNPRAKNCDMLRLGLAQQLSTLSHHRRETLLQIGNLFPINPFSLPQFKKKKCPDAVTVVP